LFVFLLEGTDEKRPEQPSIQREDKLPVVLSREALKRLIHTPILLKHRIRIALFYDCALRCMEVHNLQLIDFDLNLLLH
jgi:integrase